MQWNWQQSAWPKFKYDSSKLEEYEQKFLLASGQLQGASLNIDSSDFISTLLAEESLTSSKIEGEILNRESVRSSLRKHLGLQTKNTKANYAERGMAKLMYDLYQQSQKTVTEKILANWNYLILNGDEIQSDNFYRGAADDPMQIVSGSIHKPKVHFEAPPAENLSKEMQEFIAWYQDSSKLPAITRAGMTHLYFVSIHPYEDGNGRVARALSLKSLSESLGHSCLASLSTIIEKERKLYYQMLDKSNRQLNIDKWLEYFAQTVLKAQEHSFKLVEFLIFKTKFFDKYSTELNERQTKVIERIFREGLNGFQGGLSAENYISITGTSRATATRDLQKLVSIGAFSKIGELKSSRYNLNI